jgi:hypothetical protein
LVSEMALGLVPGVGQAMDVQDFAAAQREGSPLGMALATAGLVPVAGDVVKGAVKGGQAAAEQVRRLFTGVDPSRALPAQAHAALVKERSVVPRSLEAAQTDQPFAATMRRGEGLAHGNRGLDAVLGQARYSTPSERKAKYYAGEAGQVRDVDVRLQRPLVVTDDQQWNDLTGAAGWEYTMPYGNTQQERRAVIQKLRDFVTDQGYDGIVVKLPTETLGKGAGQMTYLDERRGRTLSKIFGSDQVIEFAPPRRPAGQYP